MTLIELLTAILVLAILMAIAVPSFREFAANSRTTAATSDLVTALNLARSRRCGARTWWWRALRPIRPPAPGDTVWTSGWIVFADGNGNGIVDANELLQTWTEGQGDIESVATADRAVYTAMGMTQAAASVTFDIKKTGCSGNRAKRVVMSIAGSLQTSKVTCLRTPR